MSHRSTAAIAWPRRTCDNGDGGEAAGLESQPQSVTASRDRGNGAAVKDGRIVGTYRYVPLDEVDEYRARGWELASGLNLNGTHHGEWARLMKEP